MGRLDGKVAIVTGAARGIGAATAELFAREGVHVALADKRDELGEAVAEQIRNDEPPGDARYVSLDVTAEDEWSAATAQVIEWFGGIDVLVNNAGIIRVSPFTETDVATFHKVLDTNVVGPFLGMQAVIDPMRSRGGGSIVNFSSPQGLEGRVGMSAYTASKFGVRGLTKAAALELGVFGIRVNAVVPGPTRTAMTERRGWSDRDYDAAYGLYPLGRMAAPSEIAALCLFLASDEASFCTGADFVADGGVTAGKPRGAVSPAPRVDSTLEGRVAIVTGGGRGIGRALSLGLAHTGAAVVVTSRSLDACEEAVGAIEQAGGRAIAVAADIGRPEARQRVVDETEAAFGRLDVLVNNAGILKPHHTVKVTEEELDEIIAVNLKGPLFLAQLALPLLEANGGGSIVNLSALGAFQPMAGLGAYCAVKAAMVNWTSTMAKEWTRRGVRVNCLVPGPVATEMILPRDPDRRQTFVAEMSANTLVGRLAEPEDLVGAVLFLAGDASSFMTGRSLFLDGGMLA